MAHRAAPSVNWFRADADFSRRRSGVLCLPVIVLHAARGRQGCGCVRHHTWPV